MDFFRKLFKGTGRGLKSDVTTAVKPAVSKEEDPWEQVEVVQDKGGLKNMTGEAAKIAQEERLGAPVNPEGGNNRA